MLLSFEVMQLKAVKRNISFNSLPADCGAIGMSGGVMPCGVMPCGQMEHAVSVTWHLIKRAAVAGFQHGPAYLVRRPVSMGPYMRPVSCNCLCQLPFQVFHFCVPSSQLNFEV